MAVIDTSLRRQGRSTAEAHRCLRASNVRRAVMRRGSQTGCSFMMNPSDFAAMIGRTIKASEGFFSPSTSRGASDMRSRGFRRCVASLQTGEREIAPAGLQNGLGVNPPDGRG
jgi:hypothetical protein